MSVYQMNEAERSEYDSLTNLQRIGNCILLEYSMTGTEWKE